MTTLGDGDLTNLKPYVKEHEQIKSRGWAYYAFNVTDDDYQVVVNVAEEEDSKCKLTKLQHAALLQAKQNLMFCTMHDPAAPRDDMW